MSEINWSSLKTQADDATRPLDPGRYRFQVVRPDVKMSSTGKWMIVVHLVVQGGPKHGKDLMNNFVLTPDSAFSMNRWFSHFEALGLDESFWQRMSESGLQIEQSLRHVAAAIDGRLVEADVDIRDYAGRQVNDFKSFIPVSGQPPISADLSVSISSGMSNGRPPTPSVGHTMSPPAPSMPNPQIPHTPPRVATPVIVPPAPSTAPPEEPF